MLCFERADAYGGGVLRTTQNKRICSSRRSVQRPRRRQSHDNSHLLLSSEVNSFNSFLLLEEEVVEVRSEAENYLNGVVASERKNAIPPLFPLSVKAVLLSYVGTRTLRS